MRNYDGANSPYDPKHKWYWLLARLVEETESLESGIDCVRLCDGRCCPRPMIPPHTGFIIFLPYEFEFLSDKLKIPPERLQKEWHIRLESVELNSGDVIQIAWTRWCPFFKSGKCGIYASRPFDCRMFPMVPSLVNPKILNLAKKCPQVHTVRSQFETKIQRLWDEVCAELPMGWWELEKQLVISNEKLTL